MSRPNHHRRAFTLIELLMVIALIGILSGAVLPSTTPSIYSQLNSAARVVAADLAYCRSLAVTNNSTYSVTFDTDKNQYVIEHTGSNSALDDLPQTPFRSPDDPSDQQIVSLADLPRVGIEPKLFAVLGMEATPTIVTDIEFGPLGATTRSEESVVWFLAGHGSELRFISVRVNPITGLTWIENYQTSRPPATEPD